MIGLSQLTSKGLPSVRAGAKVMLLCMLALGTGDAGAAGVEGLKLTASMHRAQVGPQGAPLEVSHGKLVPATAQAVLTDRLKDGKVGKQLVSEAVAAAERVAMFAIEPNTVSVRSTQADEERRRAAELRLRDANLEVKRTNVAAPQAASGTQRNQEFTKRGTGLCVAAGLGFLILPALMILFIGQAQSGKFEP